MYDINFNNMKKGYKFHALFIIVGLLFGGIILGIIIHNSTLKKSMDSSVMSDRVEITSYDGENGTMYSPVYYYTVDGKEYECKSSSSSNSMPSEENKNILYNSKNPEKCYSPYTSKSNKILYFVLFIPIIFLFVGVINVFKISKNIKRIKQLNKTGKLVKNLQFSMEDTGAEINGNRVQRLVVDYTLPNGTTLTLRGDPRYDYKYDDDDHMVDLVIDENNTDNYFIDFEINRIGGNLPEDYATQNNVVSTQPQYQNQQQYPQQMYTGQPIQQQYPQQMYTGQPAQQQYPQQMYTGQPAQQQYPQQMYTGQPAQQQYPQQTVQNNLQNGVDNNQNNGF